MAGYRFAISGAQGVGKSTLSKALFQACNERFGEDKCALLEGLGQRVAALGYPVGGNANLETLCVFAHEHLSRERQCQSPLIIQDRCFLDLFAYARVLDRVDRVFFDLLSEVALWSLHRLDTIFYVPICEELKLSRVEWEDSEFRLEVDREIVAGARDLGIPLKRIEGTAKERTHRAFAHVCDVVQGLVF